MTRGTPYYFDGCQICGAVKQADDEERPLSTEELLEAFNRQNASQQNRQQAAAQQPGKSSNANRYQQRRTRSRPTATGKQHPAQPLPEPKIPGL